MFITEAVSGLLIFSWYLPFLCMLNSFQLQASSALTEDAVVPGAHPIRGARQGRLQVLGSWYSQVQSSTSERGGLADHSAVCSIPSPRRNPSCPQLLIFLIVFFFIFNELPALLWLTSPLWLCFLGSPPELTTYIHLLVWGFAVGKPNLRQKLDASV